MADVEHKTAAAGPTVHPVAILSVMAGLVCIVFCMNEESSWHWWAWPASLVAIFSGVNVLEQGLPGGKLALSGLVLGTVGLCVMLVQHSRGVYSLVGLSMMLGGWQLYAQARRRETVGRRGQ